jgi:hypothetical protein
MIRLNLIVEGQTELGFVDALLKPHLETFHVYTSAEIWNRAGGEIVAPPPHHLCGH